VRWNEVITVTLRILHITTRHRRGGAERNLRYTTELELARGYDVHVAVGTEGFVNDFPSEVRCHPVDALVRDLSPVADVRATAELRGLIRAYGYDVVHTHQSKAGVLGRLAARTCSAVVVHTAHMASFGPGYRRRQSAAFLAAERACARATDLFVFVGRDLLRRYVHAGAANPDRSRVIHSPIPNLSRLSGLRPRRHHAHSADGPGNPPLLVAIGALDRRKRHALLVSELAPLLARGEARLAIAGEGPEMEALLPLRARLGLDHVVQLHGYVSDIEPLLAKADVFVQSSSVEGVSQAVIQALMAGVPVVATDTDGLREVDNAPVTIVRADATGLRAAVLRTLATADDFPPVPEHAFRQWLPEEVERRLHAFHEVLEATIAGRRRTRRKATSARDWTRDGSAIGRVAR
jgi:glycosyltransferase involved in cell wall biosynthesis